MDHRKGPAVDSKCGSCRSAVYASTSHATCNCKSHERCREYHKDRMPPPSGTCRLKNRKLGPLAMLHPVRVHLFNFQILELKGYSPMLCREAGRIPFL